MKIEAGIRKTKVAIVRPYPSNSSKIAGTNTKKSNTTDINVLWPIDNFLLRVLVQLLSISQYFFGKFNSFLKVSSLCFEK